MRLHRKTALVTGGSSGIELAVFDTNIFVSALAIAGGQAKRAIDLVIDARVNLCISKEIIHAQPLPPLQTTESKIIRFRGRQPVNCRSGVYDRAIHA